MPTIDKINLHGTEYHIGTSPILLENGTNFDDVREPGDYIIGNVVNSAYVNCPFDSGSGSLIVQKAGAFGQLHQIATVCNKTNIQKYERLYYSSSWGEWVNTTNFNSRLLWSGVSYMDGGQSAPLSGKISNQLHGIILVFSPYSSSSGVAENSNFSSFFVPKYLVANHNGAGSNFQMNTVMFGTMATKKLYISDEIIHGDANNKASGTGNGITYNNAHYVLRYVIGI